LTLDEALPTYDFYEVHSVRVEAPPERALAEAEQITLAEIPVAAALLRTRSLPALTRGRPRPRLTGRRSMRDLLESGGFVRLDEEAEPGREIVYGVVGRFWRLAGNAPVRLPNAAAFVAFAEPGTVKAALGFRAVAENGGARLMTETRVTAMDDTARRSFARYWRVIRPFSGLIRVVWLRAAKRRAETAN
jgi:hypothetical protein